MQTIYFSATGQTKKVVQFLSQQFQENITDIDLTKPSATEYHLNKDELCIIGVPSFGGRMPQTALNHMQCLHANQTPAILVVTYGNRHYDDTLLELKDSVEKLGFQPVAAMAVVCEHSIMHQFAKGRPNTVDFQQLSDFAKTIQTHLQNHLSQVPGNYPYKEYHTIPLHPHTKQNCTQCGLCIQECPVQAIDKDNPALLDTSQCISCMRCVSLCPQHARECSKIKIMVATQKLKKVCSVPKENELFM